VSVRGNVKHKLGRLHYVQESAEEAANVSTANHSANKWNPSHNGHAGWYDAHMDMRHIFNFGMGFFFGML